MIGNKFTFVQTSQTVKFFLMELKTDLVKKTVLYYRNFEVARLLLSLGESARADS